MSKGIYSVLNFRRYVIEEFVFKKNDNYKKDSSEPTHIEYEFGGFGNFNQEENRAYLVLTCNISDESFSENKMPFFIQIRMGGYFDCNEGINIEEFEIASTAILLPYLRAFITSMTAQAGIPPLIMPAINVYAMLNERKNKTS